VFTKAAIQHLRLRFSLLLMPVFLLGLLGLRMSTYYSCVFHDDDVYFSPFTFKILIGFLVYHLLLYPASNAYNSYQDQDDAAIGDIKNPIKADIATLIMSILFDITGLTIAFFLNWQFGLFAAVYVLVSKLYSWRVVRLKRFPIIGFLVVFIFQGMWVLYSVYYLSENIEYFHFGRFLLLGLAASFMFGGGYPITQIYQHKQDKEDGVKTISMLLGIKGTLIFSGFMNAIGLGLLAYVVIPLQGISTMLLYLLILAPSFYYFSKWAAKVLKDENEANFENVMRMTWISAICNNIAILMLILKPQVIHWLQ
jgi:4-hydroxybenzoate polyprenyltransferase